MDNLKIVYEDDRAFVQEDTLNSPETSLENLADQSNKPRKMDQGLKKIIICSVLFGLSISVALIISNFLMHPLVIRHGGVTSTTAICSSIGFNVMRNKSGNAIDCMVAAALCEIAQNNYDCGVLGGGILIYRRHTHNLNYVYNFLGNNPDKSKNLESNNKLGLPTILKSLSTIHRIHGSLNWNLIVNETLNYFLKQKNISLEESQVVIEILTNISTSNVISFYDSYIIQKFANQSSGKFPNLKLIQDYEVVAEIPISYKFHDYLIEVARPPSNGVIVILFLNIMTALKNNFQVHPHSVNYNRYVSKASLIADLHIGLLMGNETCSIVDLFIMEEYAIDIAEKIFKEKPFNDMPKYNYSEFIGMRTSNVVVVGPNDDMVSFSMTLGLAMNESVGEIEGLKLNANNQLVVNLSPVMLSNPAKPCLLRLAATHQGNVSSASEVGRLILELVNNNSTNIRDAIRKTMNATDVSYNSNNEFVSMGKFDDVVLTGDSEAAQNYF